MVSICAPVYHIQGESLHDRVRHVSFVLSFYKSKNSSKKYSPSQDRAFGLASEILAGETRYQGFRVSAQHSETTIQSNTQRLLYLLRTVLGKKIKMRR